ncbi:unnamed protein product [Schistosoma margrebowiei]|uniref:Uncharacterized protein n=1 Tax=Schistosoma margrebowiei TaxID=48269 RepID=A0A3P8EED3_9TREM|nr:unnamed protein product [Schistosoma margrebowiei]
MIACGKICGSVQLPGTKVSSSELESSVYAFLSSLLGRANIFDSESELLGIVHGPELRLEKLKPVFDETERLPWIGVESPLFPLKIRMESCEF